MGVGMLPAEAFSTIPFCTDWLDTAESQELLRYQRYDLKDYARQVVALMGIRRYLVRLFRPIVRAWVLQRSPSYRRWRSARAKRRKQQTRSAELRG